MTMALRIGSVTRTATPLRPMSPAAAPAGVVPGFRRYRFLIIDPQALLRHGLALSLTAIHPGAAIQQAATLEEGLALITQGAVCDAVLMNVDDLGPDWVERVGDVARGLAPVPLLALSSSDRGADARACISAGACAVLLKSDSSEVFENAVALALAPDAYVQLPKRLIRDSRVPLPASQEPDVACLTKRQKDIFHLLQSGCSNKEIARRLGVLEGTVKVHIRAMMQKLGARNRTQMAVMAIRCERADQE